jgi:aryl-alcohol dehydrogenase-like predicted oxidoreductase
MQYRTIGTTGMRISRIGLGTWTIGGPSWEDGRASGWAPVEADTAIKAIRTAFDGGINHFDTADVYGNGHAERLLGRALAGMDREVVIGGKMGYIRGSAPHAYAPHHIRSQCEQSLKNLRRDYLDIYYFHHTDFGENDTYRDQACEAMERLRQEGKIRHIGLSGYATKKLRRLIPHIQPQVVQVPASLLNDRFITIGSEFHTLCRQYSISLITFSPLSQGVLLGKYSSSSPPVFQPGDHRGRSYSFSVPFLRRAEIGLSRTDRRFGSDIGARLRIALQYVLHQPAVTGLVAGFRSSRQVREILSAADAPLTEEEIGFVRKAFRQISPG